MKKRRGRVTVARVVGRCLVAKPARHRDDPEGSRGRKAVDSGQEAAREGCGSEGLDRAHERTKRNYCIGEGTRVFFDRRPRKGQDALATGHGESEGGSRESCRAFEGGVGGSWVVRRT